MDDLASQMNRLAEPIADDASCGASLEDTPALAAFDAYRIFGQLTPPQTEPDWRELRALSLATLNKSKDLRVLAHLTAAALRTDTLADVLQLFPLVSAWLARYWDEVYPRIDDDAIMRRNALTSFADRVAIVDSIRRLPLVTHPQLGSYSLRDFDIAAGIQPNPDSETQSATAAEVSAVLEAADPHALAELSDRASAASQALAEVEETMRSRGGGTDAVPKLDLLLSQLDRIRQVIGTRTVQTSAGQPEPDESAQAPSAADKTVAVSVGAVRSRQDAMRALDAVAGYFRSHEPSSPVPLIVERAKRLVSMSFLDVLADLAPEGLEQARKSAGVREPSE